MTLNFMLQTSIPQAKSGPQMCFVWPTQSFLKIRKFYIIIYISGFSGEPGRSSNPESEHSDAGLLPRSSHSLFPSQTLPALTAQFSVLPQGICQFLFTEDNPHIAEWLAALALTYQASSTLPSITVTIANIPNIPKAPGEGCYTIPCGGTLADNHKCWHTVGPQVNRLNRLRLKQP